jgi:acetyl-CoA carboxylase carboxyl transferase subunit beta
MPDAVAGGVASGARAALAELADDLVEHDADLVSADPLTWPGYDAQLARARERSGEPESVVSAHGRVGATRAGLVAFDFAFMGGSMGEAGGTKIARAFRRAAEAGLPVVSLHSSGGCRMQEGMRALIQMQRIAAATHVLRDAGLPHIAVLLGPTTGGAWASIAAGADVIVGVPDAIAAFAGHRVRDGGEPATIADAQCSGQVDLVVGREDLPFVLATLLGLLGGAGTGSEELPPADVPVALGSAQLPSAGWDAVQRARAAERSRAAAYLDAYFDVRIPLEGDRAGGRDAGMLCGVGRRAGTPIAYAAQAGTANTPAGFRTASRVIRLADRLGLPVLTLIDTPGALNDASAEAGAIGPAIADTFAAVAECEVPVTSLVIGEGGSGGALALASHTELWITPDAYFAVIAPESAAAILKLPPGEAPEVAERMRLRPQDLVEMGLVHGIAPRLDG